MAKKPKRPAPVDVGEVRARAVRPRGRSGPTDGRWYWRAEIARKMVWRGWALRSELPRILAEVLLEGPQDAEASIDEIQTVRDLLDVWLGEYMLPRTDIRKTTKKSARGAARRIVHGLGDYRVDRLSRLAIDQWVAQRQREGHSALTMRLDLATLKSAWSWGYQIGACPNPNLSVPKVRPVPKNEKRTPTRAEVERVIAYLSERARPWVSLVVRLQAEFGCRIGELAGLTWDRVDLDRGLVTLVGKTGQRVVPIDSDLVQLFESAPKGCKHFHGRSYRTVELETGRKIHEACAALGIEAFTTHGLRRMAVDRLTRSHEDIAAAAALLGHSPAVMLTAYRQVSEQDLRAAARALRGPRGRVVPFPKAVATSGHSFGSQDDDDAD